MTYQPAEVDVLASFMQSTLPVHSDAAPSGLRLPVAADVTWIIRCLRYREGWSRKEIRSEQRLAGRECAALALRRAGSPACAVGTCRGAPLWPLGFVGSISHSDDLVAAAVSPSPLRMGIGIDLERDVRDDTSLDIAQYCLGPQERLLLGRTPMTHAQAHTCAFSLKESLFKCLNPLTDTFFDYLEAEIVKMSVFHGTATLLLKRNLSPTIHAGLTLPGRFAFAEGHVLSAVELIGS
jgi:enterobactin synthetase component D